MENFIDGFLMWRNVIGLISWTLLLRFIGFLIGFLLICSTVFFLIWIISHVKKINRINMWPFKKKTKPEIGKECVPQDENLKPEIGKKYVFQDGDINPFKKIRIIIRVIDIKQDYKGRTWIAYHQEPYSKMYNGLWNHRDWKEYENEP